MLADAVRGGGGAAGVVVVLIGGGSERAQHASAPAVLSRML